MIVIACDQWAVDGDSQVIQTLRFRDDADDIEEGYERVTGSAELDSPLQIGH